MHSICTKRWNYQVVRLTASQVQYCCQTPLRTVTSNEIHEFGIDVFGNTPYYKDRRLEMINGIKHEDCKSCWDVESKGILSMRGSSAANFETIFKIPFTDSNINKIRNTTTKDSAILNSNEKLELLEITTSTICDLKCIYCASHSSSQWALENYQQGDISLEEYRRLTNLNIDPLFEKTFWEWFDNVAISSLSFINLKGGEPIGDPYIIPLINKFSERLKNVNKKITFSIISNFNAGPKQFKRFVDALRLLSNQAHIHVMISMESTNERAEYIRSGLNWQTFETNVKDFLLICEKNENIKVSFMPSMNILSVSSCDDFLKWIFSLLKTYKTDISIKRNIISNPSYYSPFLLSSEFSQYLDKALVTIDEIMIYSQDKFSSKTSKDWERFKQFIESIRDSIANNKNVLNPLIEKTVARLIKNDSIRNTDHRTIFPEYISIFDKNIK